MHTQVPENECSSWKQDASSYGCIGEEDDEEKLEKLFNKVNWHDPRKA